VDWATLVTAASSLKPDNFGIGAACEMALLRAHRDRPFTVFPFDWYQF
jgi:hypothetical protein